MSASEAGIEFVPDDRGQVLRAVLALAGVTLAGTLGFVWIEGWGFDRALFFTLITISTVGYGDEGISEAGRRFALVLLVGGIGVATWSFALVVQSIVARPFRWRQRMQQRISRLEGHVIVCGYGRMGRTICAELAAAGSTFVVLDRAPEAIRDALAAGWIAIRANACEDEGLLEAGIEHAAHVVSAVDSEAENIVVALTARELRPEISVIARAERDEEVRKLRRAGATRIVSPFRSGGREIAHAILAPTLTQALDAPALGEGEVGLAEVPLLAGSPLIGRSAARFAAEEGKELVLVTVQRAGCALRVPPDPEEPLSIDDVLIVAGAPSALLALRDRARSR